MAKIDEYLDLTGLQYYHNRIKTQFATQTALDTLEDKVDEIISEGGEPNVIETVKVNGTALVPDAQKAVNVEVPTATSDLLNDGDGESPFATQTYVQENGGKIDTISVNGTQQTITNKNVDIPIPVTQIKVNNTALTPDSSHAVNITVPTNVSDLTNDAGYQDETEVQALIDDALAGITSIDYQVVQSLPATGEKGIIYLVANSGTSPNVYDEYIWTGSAFEKIGTADVDLSQYWAKADLVAITTAEIDTVVGA